MTALELRNATKIFADATIDATLRVESGQQLVLLGPSGCGKTTVLRMIAGLVEPDAGDVIADGRSMIGVRPEARNAAMVFQAHALFPFQTVGENVEFGLKIRKVNGAERTERAERALAAVHLDGYRDRWPSELSGGERQRVALARAIVVEPKMLLLDEPLSSLDPVLRTELQQLICELQRSRGITSVFVTHDRDEARAVGDHVAVMLNGQVRQSGTPTQVFEHPADGDVARFLGGTAAAASSTSPSAATGSESAGS